MPKQVIVSMQENYPFGECEEISSQKVRVLVRKIYEVGVQESGKLMEKVSILRKLKNQHMIKVESVLEEEESVHFMFEYIPIKLETWISNINDEFIENFRDQLIKFSSFLANNYIKIEFQLKNIGMDQNYGAKYFLDLNFEYDKNINREKLKSSYIREISNLFKPYIMSANSKSVNSSNAIESERETSSVSYAVQPSKTNDLSRRQDTSISPPTNKPAAKNKEKALEKYYQEVNMSVDSENQKILQQFMDVLDNQEEDNAHHHQSPPPTPQTAQIGSKKPEPVSLAPKKVQPSKPVPPQVLPNSQSHFKPNLANNSQDYSSQKEHQVQAKNKVDFNSSKQVSSSQVPVQNQNKAPAAVYHQAPKSVNSPQKFESQSVGGPVADHSEAWQGSMQLQNRVKNAIEKSMNVIKKFKNIKDNMEK